MEFFLIFNSEKLENDIGKKIIGKIREEIICCYQIISILARKTEKVMKNYHHLPPWMRSLDLFRHPTGYAGRNLCS